MYIYIHVLGMSVLCGEGRCSSLFYVLLVVDHVEIGTKKESIFQIQGNTGLASSKY